MDIAALSQLSGGYPSGSAVAVPADSRALLSDIAASTRLSDAERSGLITALAQADNGLSGLARVEALSQIQMLGLYLRNTGNDGFPRWTMMTALRSYGMNLTEGGGAPGISELLGQLAEVRNVSLQTAVAVAQRMVEAPAPVTPVKVPVSKPVNHDSVSADVPHVEKIV